MLKNMRKFFRWLFKIFRPDPSGYVKNIQDGPEKDENADRGTARVKKALKDRDSLFWLPANMISSIGKNDQGLTTSIKLAPGAEFSQINYEGDFSLRIKKQGLSRVNYHLEFNPGIDDEFAKSGQELISGKKKVSILHIDRYGDGCLYGEANGLSVLEFENGKMIVEGVEDNVFYEISRECVKSIIPEKE